MFNLNFIEPCVSLFSDIFEDDELLIDEPHIHQFFLAWLLQMVVDGWEISFLSRWFLDYPSRIARYK
jgi:hypothetical protein